MGRIFSNDKLKNKGGCFEHELFTATPISSDVVDYVNI